MYTHKIQLSKDKGKNTTNPTVQTKNNEKQTLKFVDNRSENINQLKLHERIRCSTQDHTSLQRKELDIAQLRRGRGRGRQGRFSLIAYSPAALSITNMFITQHLGDRRTAIQVAENRSNSRIAASHTICIEERARLLSEMAQRIRNGYYIAQNRVMSPYAGGLQFLTDNSYHIWETRFDNRGRLKRPRVINRRFYYDVLGNAGNALHHFDGPTYE